MTTTCYGCSAETSNGLALCEMCQRKATSCLEYLPIYFRNLARWTPGRTGTRQVPGSRVLYTGPITDWFRWFAWHPIHTLDRGWRWMVPVWRRRCLLHDYLPDGGAGRMWWQHVVIKPAHSPDPAADPTEEA